MSPTVGYSKASNSDDSSLLPRSWGVFAMFVYIVASVFDAQTVVLKYGSDGVSPVAVVSARLAP